MHKVEKKSEKKDEKKKKEDLLTWHRCILLVFDKNITFFYERLGCSLRNIYIYILSSSCLDRDGKRFFFSSLFDEM